MLEVLFLVFLCKQIGQIVRPLGRSAGGYQAMLVLLWILGEICGGLAGTIMTNSTGGMYLFALIGAAAGATVTFVIVKNLSPLYANRPTGGFPVSPVGRDPGEM